jgi:hypothetical protein
MKNKDFLGFYNAFALKKDDLIKRKFKNEFKY